MKKYILYTILIGSIVFLGQSLYAQNPIIQTSYTADPAPLVHNGKVYLYTGHDEDGSTWFTMNDWKVFSSDDMVNWTEHPCPISYKIFAWASSDAWAAHCIERNGKFYMYCPVINRTTNSPAVGVAVADSPYGPFYDALEGPLVQTGHGDIDPAVFIDDDGQAYLYWGNPNCYFVKLNDDMISYHGDIITIPLTEESFGKREGDPKRATLYEEGAWLYKRNDIYYLFWAGGPIPEHLGYSTSDSPEGPWQYGGVLMPAEGGSFTNHPGVIDYKGNTYLFYHDGGLPGGGGFTRSVCVTPLTFNENGSISAMKMNPNGIEKGLSTLNPYLKNEGETIAWSEGIKSAQNDQVGVFVIASQPDSYIKVRDVDFSTSGTTKFTARVGSMHNDITMEIRVGGIDGELLGTMPIPRTGGSDRWSLETIDVKSVKGINDLFFVFKGHPSSNLAFLDYWRFIDN